MKTCHYEGCTKTFAIGKWCPPHRPIFEKCEVEWCRKPVGSGNFCLRHYYANRDHGHPYLHPTRDQSIHPDVALRPEDLRILRYLANGKFHNPEDIQVDLEITAFMLKQSIERLRQRFGYDVVIIDGKGGPLKLREAIPGVSTKPTV